MSGLARLGITGERSRRAQDNLGRASADLVLALRRVLPFLTRKRVAVVAAPARAVLFAELAEAVPDLVFKMPFTAGARRAPGILAIDAVGAARILDGVLGGGEEDPSAGGAGELSSAQLALAGRVGETILRAFSDALRARLGVALEPMAGTATTGDARMAAVMVEVEIDVVAELGQVRLPLSRLATLAVGDVIQLSLSLDEEARVCAGGTVLFRGRPIASGVTIGIAIERHAT